MTADTTTLYISSQVASRDLLSRPAPTSAGTKRARYNGVPKIGSKESVHFERGVKERGDTETKREREEENSFGFPVMREFLRICIQCRL
jgi:hypothetical protein